MNRSEPRTGTVERKPAGLPCSQAVAGVPAPLTAMVSPSPHPITFMKSNLANYACGFLLLGALATTSAQTTWNYFISDAGGGNSLVTWNVAGSLATPPGALRVITDRNLSLSVSAPG